MPLLTIRSLPAAEERPIRRYLRQAFPVALVILWTAALLATKTSAARARLPNEISSFLENVSHVAGRTALMLPPLLLALALHAFISVPQDLAHLPRAPLWPLLKSYIRNEPDDVRYRTQLLPMLDRDGHGVVLVWTLGRWMVHVLDYRLGRAMAETMALEKEAPPDGMLLWNLIGRKNFIFANGLLWRKHASIIKLTFDSTKPMDAFVEQSKALFEILGKGGRILVDDYAQRFALATVGISLFGYDFEAMTKETPVFIQRFNSIMKEIASPAYLVLPFLERLLPRPRVHAGIATFRAAFQALIDAKRHDKGTDLVSFMLEDESMSQDEVCDNLITFFIASHDSSSGTISSLMYYLAVNPEYQQRARTEVLSAIGSSRDPTVQDIAEMHFLHACVREVLRINTPTTSSVPRACASPIQLGAYEVPARASILPNSYVWHHSERNWQDAYTFRPERWLLDDSRIKTTAEAWLPFSTGSRQCSGRNFALLELRTFFCLLLQNYEWSLPADSIHKDGIKNAVSPFALSLPHEMYMDIRSIAVN